MIAVAREAEQRKWKRFDCEILNSSNAKTYLNKFEDFYEHIQALTPQNGGEFGSKLPAWETW